MSRIHDALKKAEQEKAAGGGLDQARQTAETSVAEVALPSSSHVQADGRATKPLESGSFIMEEGLLEKCPEVTWNPDKAKMVFAGEQGHGLGTEQFRSLRSHLYLVRKEKPLKRILITSPLPKEGKSFVAGNLALTFVQQQDRRVLLVDADLRVSGLHKWLGAPPAPGLTDYLLGEVDELAVTQRGFVENLFFIPAGKVVSKPSELIGNGRLKTLLDRLAPAFDWIILDSPPATLVSDARMLAEMCDGILVVVQACTTPFDLAQKGCLEFRGRRVLGAVLNRAEATSAYSYLQYYQQVRDGDKPETGASPQS